MVLPAWAQRELAVLCAHQLDHHAHVQVGEAVDARLQMPRVAAAAARHGISRGAPAADGEEHYHRRDETTGDELEAAHGG